MEEVEEIGGRIQLWDEPQSKTREMTWCNDSNDEGAIRIITPIPKDATTVTVTDSGTKSDEFHTIICPSCGHQIEFQDQVFFLLIYIMYYLSFC